MARHEGQVERLPLPRAHARARHDPAVVLAARRAAALAREVEREPRAPEHAERRHQVEAPAGPVRRSREGGHVHRWHHGPDPVGPRVLPGRDRQRPAGEGREREDGGREHVFVRHRDRHLPSGGAPAWRSAMGCRGHDWRQGAGSRVERDFPSTLDSPRHVTPSIRERGRIRAAHGARAGWPELREACDFA